MCNILFSFGVNTSLYVDDEIKLTMASELVKRYTCVEDKVFLVTGGAAGVGAAVVRALLEENARVCIN